MKKKNKFPNPYPAVDKELGDPVPGTEYDAHVIEDSLSPPKEFIELSRFFPKITPVTIPPSLCFPLDGTMLIHQPLAKSPRP